MIEISEPYGVGLVTHVRPDRNLTLSVIFDEIQFENFAFLLEIGSIYVDGVRVFENIEVPAGKLVRIHRNPKRHPIQNIDWSKHIVENNEHFVVIDKPYGVPTHATVDNSRENAFYQLGQHLGQELFMTHRLDSETTGLLLYAKTKQFQHIFNYLISNKYVLKKYKALSAKAPKAKHHLQYMKPDKYLPKMVSDDPIEGWQSCELIVEQVTPITLPNGNPGFESTIQLITGRTHQIRAQFTGMDCTLFGDVLYGDANADFSLGLKSFHLSFSWPQENKQFRFEIP